MQGKVIVVTGASDGIGRATADRLAAEGARVVMIARGRDKLEAAAAEIGGAVETAALDVTDTAAFEAAIAGAAARHGRLDGLVNNAAHVSMGMIVDTDEAAWRATFAAGVDAVFTGTRAALRVMMAQGSGSIVNISSTNGRRAMAAMGAYSASKAALIQFSKVAAMEAGPSGVRVNALAPGMVMTPGNAAFYETMPEALDAVSAAIPARRGGRPEEIAGAIRFLLSDDASYVNGICLDVDGGKAAQLYMPG
ncbi:SDR family NAD(P)-dependent oxidoreductase [Sphingomonas jatrophae]|uniref:NADP-dependent 3-hydroxy acid dehydrogenase YdfG n=1 Tax=Sphingomonas jatrophae TaxID=1166337 RepID=A0A1I6KHL9_9SPHN|nr:SDR family oxidoreductase [Sphingomonas jatrophae]SFR90711.1 NADP-dependent 3-hydroxy acid dehydrogenase YdfG [Sphingomonas jatrophae]